MARKKISQELDLTPFIGLFAMLVVLLLVTASWSKLYSFKTKFSKSVESLSANEPQPDKKKETTLKIQIYGKQIIFVEEGPKPKKSPMALQQPLNAVALGQKVEAWLKRFGAKKQITIESEGKVGYGVLIEMYDVIFGAGMEAIAFSTGNLKAEDL